MLVSDCGLMASEESQQIPQAKDECGTMKDELKERTKPEEGVRGGQEQVRFGTRAGMSLKTKEMPVYDRPSSFYSTKTNEVEAREKLGFKI
jgi:hypothetical protein